MTSTDELRRLLDERGVEYEANRIDFDGGNYNIYTEWGDISYVEYADGTVLRIFDCTPEQAIAATLGSGTCHERTCHIVTTWCDSDYLHDVNYRCSECGGLIVVDERNPDDYFEIISHANYCCNCGAKVLTP